MIIVRNIFVAKPGQASKLAAQMKDAASSMGLANVRVLTDMTGEFNRVVMEHSVENLADLEARLQKYANDPAVKEKMKGYTDLWETGSRELLRVM
jgi:hypothetical protein